MTEQERDEHKYLVEKHASTEQVLLTQAKTLLNVADTASTDTYKLHDKIGRKKKVEEENESLSKQFQANIKNRFHVIENDLSIYTHELVQFCMSVKTQIEAATNEGLTSTMFTTKKLGEDIDNSFLAYGEWLQKEMEVVCHLTEDQRNRLNELSTKSVPRIESLIKTKLAENLNRLNDSITQKLQCIAAFAKTSISEMRDYRLADRNRLCKNIEEIKQTVQSVFQGHHQRLQKRQQFAKIFEDMYEDENQWLSAVPEMLNHINKICDNMNDQVTDFCRLDINKEENFQIKLENDIATIENDVTENRTLVEDAVQQGNVLTEEITTGLSAGCEALAKYKNLAEDNSKEFRHRTENDRTAHVALVNNINEIAQTWYASTQVGNKLENRSTESIERSNAILAQVHTTEHEIEKFLVEDMRHDVPTGSTPARKEFNYPRDLAATSPHERIIQRFRETRKSTETSDSDESEAFNLTSKDETIVSSPVADNVTLTASTPIVNENGKCTDGNDVPKYNMIRASSTSDISLISKPPFEISIQSEPDLCMENNNKENDKNEFLKPEIVKSKRLSKVRSTNRRVLGSYN